MRRSSCRFERGVGKELTQAPSEGLVVAITGVVARRCGLYLDGCVHIVFPCDEPTTVSLERSQPPRS